MVKEKDEVILRMIFLRITLFLFVSLLLTCLLVFNLSFYKIIFEKNKIYENLETRGVPNQEFIFAEENLISFHSNKDALDRWRYNDKEYAHLQDVNKLFKLGIFFLVLSFFLLSGFSFDQIKKQIRFVGKIMIFSSLIFLIFALMFSQFFELFHRVIFSGFFGNELWLLANEDILLAMHPDVFFRDFFASIISLQLITGLILLFYGKKINKSSFLGKSLSKN